MSQHAAVQAALTAHPGLAALVGPRIRVDFAKESDAYPFVVFKRTGLEIIRGLDGSRHGETETFEIECWASTRAQSIDVSEQAIAALEAAQLYPEQAAPDGIDPELLDRVTVLSFEI